MTINGYSCGRASVGTRDTTSITQSLLVMGDGSVRQRTTGPVMRILEYRIPRLTNATWISLRASLETAAASGNPITIVDDYAQSHSVRVWSSDIVADCKLGRFWDVSFKFRKEV